jgi:hypothetical protein
VRNTAKNPNAHEIKQRIADIRAQMQFAAPEEFFGLLEEGLTLKRRLADAPLCVCDECMAVCDELDAEAECL